MILHVVLLAVPLLTQISRIVARFALTSIHVTVHAAKIRSTFSEYTLVMMLTTLAPTQLYVDKAAV